MSRLFVVVVVVVVAAVVVVTVVEFENLGFGDSLFFIVVIHFQKKEMTLNINNIQMLQ